MRTKQHKMDLESDVVFRVYTKMGDVIALWPAVSFSISGHHCQSYEHFGQHGSANYALVLSKTRPATSREYADLLGELKSLGYLPNVIKRATQKHVHHRMKI